MLSVFIVILGAVFGFLGVLVGAFLAGIVGGFSDNRWGPSQARDDFFLAGGIVMGGIGTILLYYSLIQEIV